MRSDQVRAFYAALGIALPAWSTREAPVRCFAHPDAHNRADRSPSCSVSLASGAWNCHGCGAHGEPTMPRSPSDTHRAPPCNC